VKRTRQLRPKSKSGSPVSSTLEGVARQAGVSSATVSRYFNSPERVAAETAARIREAVQHLDYVPNLVAGGLASSRTRLVAVVIPEIAQPIFSSTIQSITDALADAGYSVLLGLTGTSDEHADRQLVSIIGRRPDGIILTGTTLRQEARQRLRDTGISTIETWDLPADPIDLTVGFSHASVGRAVARHALAAGRRRALVISAGGVRALERRDGFVRAMSKARAPEPVLAMFAARRPIVMGAAPSRCISTVAASRISCFAPRIRARMERSMSCVIAGCACRTTSRSSASATLALRPN